MNDETPSGRRLDHLRPTRRGLAKIVLLFDTFLMLMPAILTFSVASNPRNLPRDPVLWVGLILAAGPVLGSFVTAILLLLAPRDDEEREWKLAGWTGGLFGLGVIILIVAGSLSSE
ncbi:hypothetical protein [Dactylosporangium darangshiense]|uniref:Uncharacterized protein n=1 Tax=Dactylosporangium darangshiense TaxID=579108 RepID=A0ABP8DMH6_9ACTN